MSKELINIAEITKDLELSRDIATFAQLLDTKPRPEWVKKNPFIKKEVGGQKVPIDYLPTKVVRKLRWAIFPESKTEIIEVKNIFNAIVATVRFHYRHPVSGEWMFEDGTSAMDVQTAKGAKAMDAASINANAVQKAAGAAKTYALKNALKEFGELFGGGLNDEIEYEIMESVYEEPKPELTIDAANKAMEGITDPEAIRELNERLMDEYSISQRVTRVMRNRYRELKAGGPAKADTNGEPAPAKMEPKKVPMEEAKTPATAAKATPAVPATNGHAVDPVIMDIDRANNESELNEIYRRLASEGRAKEYLPHLSNRKNQINGNAN